MIVVYTGKPGSGKTLSLAKQLWHICQRNEKYYKKTGILRYIYTNLELSEDFSDRYKRLLVNLKDSQNFLDELIKIRNADIFIEELGIYFDSENWKDITLYTKRFLALHRHYGVDIWGTAQDFGQVAISFRRMTHVVLWLNKIIGTRDPSATKPKIKYPWGICSMREVDANSYNVKDATDLKAQGFAGLKFFFWDLKIINIFNTNQAFDDPPPQPLQHIERSCLTCGQKKIYHN